MFNNMKVMMKVMGIKMPMMTMVNLYLTDLDDGLMVQKVWSFHLHYHPHDHPHEKERSKSGRKTGRSEANDPCIEIDRLLDLFLW